MTFYKYMSFLGYDFLKSPTIRISCPWHLNDPFEGMISENELKLIGERIKCIYNIPEGSVPLRDPEGIKFSKIEELKGLSGVVSLTTKYDDLLMWAHYADEHRGMVLELEEDFLGGDFHCEDGRPTYKVPKKVTYTENRVNYVEKNFKTPMDVYRCILEHALLEKSLPWNIEDEWRCIIPLEQSDKVIVPDEESVKLQFNLYKHYPKEFLPFEDNNVNENFPKILSLKNNSFNIKTFSDRVFEVNLRYDFCKYIGKESKNSIFLKNINPKKIKSIYLGHRMRLKDVIAVREALRNNLEWNHINLYVLKMKAHKYELERNVLIKEGQVVNGVIVNGITI